MRRAFLPISLRNHTLHSSRTRRSLWYVSAGAAAFPSKGQSCSNFSVVTSSALTIGIRPLQDHHTTQQQQRRHYYDGSSVEHGKYYNPRLFSSSSHVPLFPHDIGGNVHSFGGPIPPLQELQAWEQECHALFAVLATKSILTTDSFRRTIESLTPAQYNSWTYYEKWTAAMTTLLLDQGVLTREELSEVLFGDESTTTNQPQEVAEPSPTFQTGDTVRVKPYQEGVEWRRPHIRTPGYIYGVAGTIERVCGQHADPSFLAFGIASPPVSQLYRVQFRLQDLWPEQHHDHHTNDDDTDHTHDLIEVEVYEHWLEASDTSIGHSFGDTITNLFDHKQGDDCAHDHHDDHHHHGHHDDHEHHDDHHDHVHEPRPLVETRAVDREGPARPGSQLFHALVQLVVHQKQIVTAQELRDMVQRMDTAGIRLDGATLVVEAWTNSEFRKHVLEDAPAAAAATLNLTTSNPNAPTALTVLPNTSTTHNLVVCTLCSCYPSGLLGIAPSWYKSSEYRARAVREPRVVLERDFGVSIPGNKNVRVHDSTADHRYIVLPERPKGTEGWSKEELRSLVTRDSMIGVAVLPESV